MLLKFKSTFLAILAIALITVFAHYQLLDAEANANLTIDHQHGGACLIEHGQPLNSKIDNSIERNVTVSITASSKGSGVIISKKGNRYYVLTAAHVVSSHANKSFTVLTPDQDCYLVPSGSIRSVPGVDLAVFDFISDKTYKSAGVGDSASLAVGDAIRVAGFPKETKVFDSQLPTFSFSLYLGAINTILETPLEKGYAVLYSAPTKDGTSGGPIFDMKKCLVAIHGKRENQAELNGNQIEGDISAGIPINIFAKFARSLGISLNPCLSISSPQQVTPIPPYALNPEILADYRSAQEEYNPGVLQEVTKKSILSTVLQSVSNNFKSCTGEPLNPWILNYGKGSFSAPKAREVVYLVNLGDGCLPEGRGRTRIFIFSENNEFKFDVSGGNFNGIRKIKDINGDGIDELILDNLFIHMGYETINSAVVKIDNSLGYSISITQEFEEVYVGNLSGGYKLSKSGAEKKAAVLYLAMNSTKYHIYRENYREICMVEEQRADAMDAVCYGFQKVN